MSTENHHNMQMMQNPEDLHQNKLQHQILMQQQHLQQPQGGLPMVETAQFRVAENQQHNLQGNQQFLQGISTSSSPTFPVNGEQDNQQKQAIQEKQAQQNAEIVNSTHNPAIPQSNTKIELNSQQQQQSHLQSESQDISDENDGDNDDDDNENDDQAGGDEGGDDETGKGAGGNKKKYQVISQEIREKFIQKVITKQVTIKEAAKEFGLKFSTSKAILQTYKKEGRIGKKKTRQRKPRLVKKMIMNPDPLNPSQVIQQVFYTTESSVMAAKNQSQATNLVNPNSVVNAALLNQPNLSQFIFKNNNISNLPVQNYGTNPQSLLEAQYFKQNIFNNNLYPGQQQPSLQQNQQQQFNLQHSNLLNQQNQTQSNQIGGQQNAFQATLTPQIGPAIGNNDLINNFMLNNLSMVGNNNQQSQMQQGQQSQIQQQQQQSQSPTQLNPNPLHHALLGMNGANTTNQLNSTLNYNQNPQSNQQAFPLLSQQQGINTLFTQNSPFLNSQQNTSQQQQLNQLLGQQTTYSFPISKGSADFTSYLNLSQFGQPQQASSTQAQNQSSQQQQLNQFLNTQGSTQSYDIQLNPAKTESNGGSQSNRNVTNGESGNKEKTSTDDQNAVANKSSLLSELAELQQQNFKKQNYTHHFPTTEPNQSYQMNLPTTSTINTTNNSTNSSANRPSHLQSIQFFGNLGGRNESGSFDSINGNALNFQFLANQQSLENNPLYQHKLSTDSLNFNLFGSSAAGNVPFTFPSIDMTPYLFNNNTTTSAANNQIFNSQIHKNSIF
ncbi:hypothetical protein TTHERM_00046890 (macronuclear) [Tetrahymena thermophila SB210]|uniref:Insertion element IS150 protein InsJ-like helix-turn-helix domain-containing protein n=1 Tax=Tetrahymena thermophila (strain SB210) TaxID=312017 RepID=Q23DK2_TETTS|nr:hypothetical protein TTHERM_00046890 [Tetrahymena thermophila SB210]EAR94388.1 hypothetical protein TTHERM_00046890 [Tetrahymena thermophila SB210]|eukprot:XP_001014684.1 hypothetical protein TTHERM_00046890 [Tetrahymena thermophila SB210]